LIDLFAIDKTLITFAPALEAKFIQGFRKMFMGLEFDFFHREDKNKISEKNVLKFWKKFW
jgi:hypothetical protein